MDAIRTFVLAFVISFSAAVPAYSAEFGPRLPRAGFYNNAESMPVLQMINGAQKTLDIEIYQMNDPSVRAAIQSSLERGVRVRVVKEPKPVGDRCLVFEEPRAQEDAECGEQRRLKDEIER